jgi:hypothetical protein
VKDIRDKAEAIRAYAQQAGDRDLLLAAAEIRLRAERRAGQLLAEMSLSPGRPEKWSHGATISDLGITKTQSSRWQVVAKLTDRQFEEWLIEMAKTRDRAPQGGDRAKSQGVILQELGISAMQSSR